MIHESAHYIADTVHLIGVTDSELERVFWHLFLSSLLISKLLAWLFFCVTTLSFYSDGLENKVQDSEGAA